MFDRVLADAVVVVHAGFILYVALGGFLAWRWRWAMYPHLAAVAYGVGIIAVGWHCPLTPLEKYFRRRAGEEGYAGGFVDNYIEGVIYPEELTPFFRALAALAILVSYAVLLRHQDRPAPTRV